jgi:hypothetical protein
MAKGAEGWHSPSLKKVRCLDCPPDGPALAANPVGGTSALRDAQGRNAHRWRKGAAGEYLMDQFLHRRLTHGELILTDRRLPGSRANVDFLVVASSGVWLIDAKKWSGKIEYRSPTPTSSSMRLYIGGTDRTSMIDDIYSLVIPVRQVVPDWNIPIEPALVFIDGDWSDRATLRLLLSRPYRHELVWICAPKMLVKKIEEPGPLGHDDILRVGSILDRALPPR